MSTITELMLAINKWDVMIFYHKNMNVFDDCPFSETKMKALNEHHQLPKEDNNNYRFLSYDKINHKEIMSLYVRECVQDKAKRKQLFDILKRRDYVDAFVEALHELNLYDEFDVACGDVYRQLFSEWKNENGLSF